MNSTPIDTPNDMSVKTKITKCCNDVFKQFGPGLSESIYQKALCVHMKEIFKKVEMEYHLNLNCEMPGGTIFQISSLRVDLLIDNEIVIELKAVSGKIGVKCMCQCSRYMDLLGIDDGYCVNFSEKGVEIVVIEDRKYYLSVGELATYE